MSFQLSEGERLAVIASAGSSGTFSWPLVASAHLVLSQRTGSTTASCSQIVCGPESRRTWTPFNLSWILPVDSVFTVYSSVSVRRGVGDDGVLNRHGFAWHWDGVLARPAPMAFLRSPRYGSFGERQRRADQAQCVFQRQRWPSGCLFPDSPGSGLMVEPAGFDTGGPGNTLGS
jgi:hypothetical protein